MKRKTCVLCVLAMLLAICVMVTGCVNADSGTTAPETTTTVPGTTTTMPGTTTTAPAPSVPVTYTVTFAGGENAAGTAPVMPEKQAGETFQLPANTFVKEGYTFLNWSDGTETYEAGATYTMPASSVIFTAQWELLPVEEPVMFDDYKIVNGSFTKLSDTQMQSASAAALAVNKKDEFKYGTLQVEMTIPAAVTTGDHGIVFALTEGNTPSYWEGAGSSYYFFFIDANNNARLGKTGTAADGTPTWSNCGEKPIAGFTRGSVHVLKVEYNGERIKCYVDDVLYINFVDSSALVGTMYGLRAGGADIVYSGVVCQSTDVAPDMGDAGEDQIPEDAMIKDYLTTNGKFSYTKENGMISTSGNSLAVHKTGAFQSGTLEVDMLIPAAVTAGDHGIVFSLTGAASEMYWEAGASYYFFFIDAANNARLGRVGTDIPWTNCAEAPIPGFTRGTTHTLKIEKDDAFILCYVDDVLYLTYGDNAPLTGTGYGLRAGGENITYSNVRTKESDGSLGEAITGFDTISGSFTMLGSNIRSTAINSLALLQMEQTMGTVSVVTGIPTAGWTGLVFGADASGSTYYRYLVKSDLSVTLEKVTNGIATTLKTTSLVAKYATGTMVALKVIYTDGQIYTYIDDVCLIAWTDTVEGSRVGIAASSANMYYQSFAANANTTPVQADLILWGHSHMQLWGDYKTDLSKYGTVVNMGIGGSNTLYWANLIDEICSYGATKMIVMTGSNDIPYTNASTIMDMEKEIYAELLRRIPNLEIYLITEFLQPCRLDYADRVRELNAMYFLYESQNSFVTVVDAYDIVLNADGSLNQNVFIDIYHLTGAGYDVLASRVCAALDGNSQNNALNNYDVVSGAFSGTDSTITSTDANSIAILKNIGYDRILVQLNKTGAALGGIVFGYSENGYYYFVTNDTNAQLYKVTGGNAQLLKEAAGEYGLNQNLSVKFADGEITCCVNDGEVIRFTDSESLTGQQFGVIAAASGVAFENLYAEKVLGKYIFTVGNESNWEITTKEDGTTVYKSLEKNSMLMFRDLTFTGGTIEFDMTVNATFEEHFFSVVNGVIFGATRLDLTHDLGNWYCFGRWPGDGQMVGFSKNNDLAAGQFLWENVDMYLANVAVGQKVHYKFVWDSENNKVYIWANGGIMAVANLQRDFDGQYVGIYCDSANTVIENLTFTPATTRFLSEEEKAEKFNFTVNTANNWVIEEDAEGNYTYHAIVNYDSAMLMFKDVTFAGGTVEFDMVIPTTSTTFNCLTGIVFGGSGIDCAHNTGSWYACGREQWMGFNTMSKDNGIFAWEDSNKFVGLEVGVKYHYKFVWNAETGTVDYYLNGEYKGTQQLSKLFDGTFVGIYCETSGTQISNLTFTSETAE